MFPLKLSEKMFFISFFWWTNNNNQPHLSFIAKKTQKAINWVFEMKKNLRLKRFFLLARQENLNFNHPSQFLLRREIVHLQLLLLLRGTKSSWKHFDCHFIRQRFIDGLASKHCCPYCRVSLLD